MLAEDFKIVRNGIKSLLGLQDDIQVIGDAATGADVLKLLDNGTVPDIVLTDISLSEMDGIALTGHLKQHFPAIKVVILSTIDNERYIFDAFDAGAKAYLLKSTTIDELLFVLKQIAENNYRLMICADLGIRMLKRASKFRLYHTDDHLLLTTRELEILTLISEGLTNQEIAEKTFTSKRTIEGHRQNLIDKMGVKNTAQLIKTACKTGLI